MPHTEEDDVIFYQINEQISAEGSAWKEEARFLAIYLNRDEI